MLRHIRFTLIPLLIAAPLTAQQPPQVDRLEALRLQRMKEALELNEEQMQALRSSFEELRLRHRELREGDRAAMERLRQALQSEPVDEAAVGEALQAIEDRRAEAGRFRAEHDRRLAEILGPEQRGRLLLFNHQFDARLKELIARRRGGPGARGEPPTPGFRDGRAPSWRAPDQRSMPPGPSFDRRRESREQEIQRLQHQIERLQRRLQELERGDR